MQKNLVNEILRFLKHLHKYYDFLNSLYCIRKKIISLLLNFMDIKKEKAGKHNFPIYFFLNEKYCARILERNHMHVHVIDL